MNIKKFAVEPTKRLHLRDASDQLMYADEEKTLPMAVNIYGPGSKQYAKAKNNQSVRITEKYNRNGKIKNLTAEQTRNEVAEFLKDCVESWENVEYEKITEKDALSMAIFMDTEIGFIADQIDKELKEWGNFTKLSQAS